MIRVLSLLLLLLPGVLTAQPIVVRSGEHGAFTRLVLRLPQGVEWQVEQQSKDKIIIKMDNPNVSFDLSEAFRRITEERVESLDISDDGELIVTLSCPCGAESVVVDPNLLVVDISEQTEVAVVSQKATEEEDGFDGPGAPEANSTSVSRPSPLLDDLSRVQIGPMPTVGPRREADPLLPRLPSQVVPLQTSLEARGDESPIAEPMRSPRLGEQLAEDLANAATMGLLTPAVTMSVAPHDTDTTKASVGNPPDQGANLQSMAQDLISGISNASHDTNAGRISIGGETCIDNKLLLLSHWVENDAEPSTVLASQRQEIFGEFDRVDRDALARYARSMIYFGFGAEARMIMNMNPDPSFSTLIGLSYLVDGEADPTGKFLDQAECPGTVAFWSVLADENLKSKDAIDTNAVVRAFEGLPVHLKEHLGIRLAEQLSKSGYTAEAEDIFRRIERVKGIETEEISLKRAQIDIDKGEINDAETRLKPLSETGGDHTPDAIISRVDVAEVKEEPLPQRVVDLAESYAQELRFSEKAGPMWSAYTRAQILNGNFLEVFESFESSDQDQFIESKITLDKAVQALVDRADDATFLRHVVKDLDTISQAADTLIIQIAGRLNTLSLPDEALRYLDLINSEQDSRQVRLERAKALIELDRAGEAEILLIGLKGQDVALLRAETRRRMGDYLFAQEIYQTVGDKENAATSAWLSGDWEELEATGDGILAEASQMINAEQTQIETDGLTLDAASELTSESSESLATLRALLEKTRLDREVED